MKEYLEKRREELRKENGFTLMEMLIVVAIIAILIAIAIPVFTGQLEKAREAADAANIRSAYAEVMMAALENDATTDSKTVNLSQTQEGWQTSGMESSIEKLVGSTGTGYIEGTPKSAKTATISWVQGTSGATGHVKIVYAS